jgi:hypothetical protein
MALVSVLLTGCSTDIADAELPEVPSPSTPSTLDQAPVPKTLEDALQTLERAGPADFLIQIREGDEDVVGSFHSGLGTWMRNNWGLWQKGPLYHDLARHGLQHPDDMSGVILTSFWRRQHRRPLELVEQVKKYQAYWEAARAMEVAHNERVKQNEARIRSMVLGFTADDVTPPRLRLPARATGGLQARFMTPYRGGALVGIRDRGKFDDALLIRPYYFKAADNTLSPVRVGGLDQIASVVKIVDDVWVVGHFQSKPRLIQIGSSHRAVTLPRDEMPQLGVDGDQLLAVYRDTIYRRDNDRWTVVYQGAPLPLSGPPPRRVGPRIYFRDEGRYENGKRLWWLELTGLPKLVAHDAALGIGWEDAPSYAFGADGSFWFTAGGTTSSLWSLIRRTDTDDYGLAVVRGQLTYQRTLPEQVDVNISAISLGRGGDLVGAGNSGLYRLANGNVQPLVRFANTDQVTADDLVWRWDPCEVLELGDDRYLIGGLFGGIYLVAPNASGSYQLTSLDENVGDPVDF